MTEVRAGENATPANVVKAYKEVICGKTKKQPTQNAQNHE